MIHHVLELVRREVSGERALETIRALTRFHRVQASPGYDQASEWMAGQLERAGLAVEIERVPGDGRTRLLGQVMPEGWQCDRAAAVLIEGHRRERLCDYEAEPLSLVLRSAPASGRHPLVAVGEGTEEADYDGVDVRGCVVLARGDVHRVHELAVLARGAAGMLTDTRRLVSPVRERHDETDALNYTSFWWSGDEPRGWGFVVTPRRGDELRERLARGARLELEVRIEARAFPTTIPLLSGLLPGDSGSEVLVISHLCHPQPSANDNASGAAANLESARTLAALAGRAELEPSRRTVRFLWVPELTGTYAFFARGSERSRAVVAALNLDMVGEDQEQCGSTFLLEHPPAFAASFAETLLARIRESAVDWVPSYSGPGHYSMTRMADVPYAGGSDHAVMVDPAIGVPCPMLIQWPDRFYHSSHDTPDKSDPRSLALAARCAATYAGFLAGAGESERRWLAAAVAREARRRILRALDLPEASRGVDLEVMRGERALDSLIRLGADGPDLDVARRDLRAFAKREAGASSAELDRHPHESDGAAARPRRRLGAPLGFPRRLLSGWAELPREAREAWRRLELQTADAYGLTELAWFACDGRRTLAEIEQLVWLETGRRAPEFTAALFDLTARLGLSEWTPAEDRTCKPRAPDTVGR